MLRNLFQVRRGEGAPVLSSSALAFLLLFAYQLLRPVRDEISAENADDLPWIWTGTFVVSLLVLPLYAWAAGRFRRGVFLPLLDSFLAANLLLLFVLLRSGPQSWRAPLDVAFYVWLSVVVMFLTASFWSLMADRFGAEQGKRLFAPIALGFTLGKLAGAELVRSQGAVLQARVPFGLLVLAALALAGAAVLASVIDRRSPLPATASPVSPGVLDSITAVVRSPFLAAIAAFILLMTVASSVVYITNAHVVAAAFPTHGLAETAVELVRAERQEFYAGIHLGEQIATILLQALLAGWLMRRCGLGVALAALPLVAFVALLGIGLRPGLLVLAVAQAVLPAVRYAIAKPAREVLYTVVSRDERYKAKAFLDAPLYRGGDVLSGWLFAALLGLGAVPGEIALYTAPAMLLWLAVALWLGRRHEERAGAYAAECES